MSSADSSIKKIGVHLLFVFLLSYLIVSSDIRVLPWNSIFILTGWGLIFSLLVFWMVRRGSRLACVLLILGCPFNIIFSLIATILSYNLPIFKSGFLLASAVTYGVFVIQLLIVVFRKNFPSDPNFPTDYNSGQVNQFFQNRRQFIFLIRSFFTSFYAFFTILILFGSSYVCWNNFHPTDCTEAIDGPAGRKNRAYFETCGFADPTFTLYAADWPDTFERPFCVGDTYRKYGGWGTFYWSADGSLVVMTYQDDKMSQEYFAAAYDYREHQGYVLMMASEKIEALVKARGGLGPQVTCVGP